MHTAYDKIVPFNMKYHFLPNFFHDFQNNCISIAGIINLRGIVPSDAFSHYEYFIYIFSLRLFILRIFRGSKSLNYQSIFSHSHYDSHAATVSQHEFIHNEKISMGKTGCNRTKKSAIPSKKKNVFIVRMWGSKRLQKRHKSTQLMQPFMP